MFSGVRKGVQLCIDFIRFVFWAVGAANAQAITDAKQVADIWLTEAADLKRDAAGIVTSAAAKGGIGWQLMTGDPFAGSRRAFYLLRTKYPDFK